MKQKNDEHQRVANFSVLLKNAMKKIGELSCKITYQSFFPNLAKSSAQN